MGIFDKGIEECEGLIESFKQRMKASTGRDVRNEDLKGFLNKIILEKVEREFQQTFADQTLQTLLNCNRVLETPAIAEHTQEVQQVNKSKKGRKYTN